jgi:signal peptidase II
VAYYKFLKTSDRLLHWALAFILPGALGNLFDRLIHPGMGVVDFIKVDLGFRPFNPWPIFNVADAWVTIGVVLMIASFLFEGNRHERSTSRR